MRFKITPLEERIVLDATLMGDLTATVQADPTNGPVDLMRFATSINDKPALRADGTSVEPVVFGNTIYVPTEKNITEVKFDLSGGDIAINSIKSLKIFGSINNPDHLTIVNGSLFFTSNENGTDVLKMYKNGTMTTLTSTSTGEVLKGQLVLGDGKIPTVVGNQLYFVARNNTIGTELWISDAQGTLTKVDIRPGPEGSNPDNLTSINNKLYFSANNGTNGNEPWISSGNTTTLLRDIVQGPQGSNPENFIEFKNQAFFSAKNNNFQLWKSNGTLAGTDLVRGGNLVGQDPFQFDVIKGNLYFFTKYDSGLRIWVSNGESVNQRAPIDNLRGFLSTPLQFERDAEGKVVWFPSGELTTGFIRDIISVDANYVVFSTSLDNKIPTLISGMNAQFSSKLLSEVFRTNITFTLTWPSFGLEGYKFFSTIPRQIYFNGGHYFTIDSSDGVHFSTGALNSNKDGIPSSVFKEIRDVGPGKTTDLIKMNNSLYVSTSSKIMSFRGGNATNFLQKQGSSSAPFSNFINLTAGNGSSDSMLFAISTQGSDQVNLWVGKETPKLAKNGAQQDVVRDSPQRNANDIVAKLVKKTNRGSLLSNTIQDFFHIQHKNIDLDSLRHNIEKLTDGAKLLLKKLLRK